MAIDVKGTSTAGTALLTAATPVVWGTTYIVATELLPPGRPMFAALMRALPVGLAFLFWKRRLPSGSWWWRAFVLGFLNIGAFFGLLFVAAFRLPGGVAATAGAIQPLLAAVLAASIIGERLLRKTAVAGVIGMLGVALLVLQPSAQLDAVGVAAALLAALSMALGVVLTKRWGRPVDLVTFTGWQLTAGGMVLLPVAFIAEGLPSQLTVSNLGGLVWLSLVGTGLAYANWFRGVQTLPVSTSSFLGLLSPLVATVSGWVVLGQQLTFYQLAGAGLVLGAVLIPQVRSPFRPRRPDNRQPAISWATLTR